MSEIYPHVIVESKNNNSELVKAVKSLSDENNRYIIVFDNSFDNVQLYMELKNLKRLAAEKTNVVLLDLVCFEFILLEFDKLIDWIYAPNDEFMRKRAGAVAAREKLIEVIHSGEYSYKDIREVVAYDKNISNHNIEQLSAKLLFDLTRNTGFEVTKSTIGECWIKACCEYGNRHANDICGLDEMRLSLSEKMKSIFLGTSLCNEFSRIKLEVTL